MKRTGLLLLAAVTIFSCTKPKQQTAKGALSDMLTSCREHKSISYSINLRIKPFTRTDTSNTNFDCKLIRNLKDTLFNGYVWLLTKRQTHTVGRYFDMDSIYYFDDSTKSATIYNDPKTEYGVIAGNIASLATNTFFLDTTELSGVFKDSTVKTTFSMDKIGNINCWKVFIKYPDDLETKDKRRNIWINPADSSLIRMTYQRKIQGNESYREWDIDNVMFDKETPASLKAMMKDRLATYQIKYYVAPSPESQKPLNNGTKAPDFTGTEFATGKQVSLADYKGKVVLLDFWYVDCIWCIKAMPSIESIRDKFEPKGLTILGINSTDVSDAAKKRIPDFIKANKNTYPTILTDKATDKMYNIQGYPTFYLINKKGEITYSFIGYDNKMDSTLTAEISKLITK